MLISPPFLSLTEIPVYDDQCVNTVMPGGVVGSGAFPVSQAMGWHGGLHLHPLNTAEPVRAIADGVVIFRRANVNARYDNQDHSTGCVVIRHTTDIGAQGTAPVTVTYYSVTQHLLQLDANLPAVGSAIYRKDKLGMAGSIHGQAHRIHFEIIAGDEDTRKLVGRLTGELPTSSDGRTDAVYGQMYVRVPAKTPYYSAQPTGTLPSSAGDSGSEELIVGIQYETGSATLATYKTTGEQIGSVSERDAEYNLYTEAVTRHGHAPTGSSPSGWYELLRFGRNLGPDPLPASASHWRKVALPGQPGGAWIDLNANGTKKFSDADFPHWRGWKLIDDDVTDNDSRCDSAMIDRMLAPPRAKPGETATPDDTPAQKASNRIKNLCKGDVQDQLARTICKFPTEWAKDEVRARWFWTRKTGNPYMPYPLEDERDFTEMADFAEKLCFWEQLPVQDKTRLTIKHWHFHPREFIKHFRKCGWLSVEELKFCMPKYTYFTSTGNPRVYQTANPITQATAKSRFETHYIALNKVMQKYGLGFKNRTVHFIAQTIIETDRWRVISEYGSGAHVPAIPMTQYYAAFYGRGIMQLTWINNYVAYADFRMLPDNNGNYSDARITQTSVHWTGDPANGAIQINGLQDLIQQY